MRDFETNRHLTDRYAIVSIYFNEKNENDNAIRAMIIRKMHLINEL